MQSRAPDDTSAESTGNKSEARQFNLTDHAGVRLQVVWSRSGRTIGVGVIAPGFAQLGLDASQAAELGAFLAQDPERRASIELQDPENANAHIEAAWNHAATRLMITMQPASSTRWAAEGLPAVTLMMPEARRLASFLNAGSPGPL